jgi:hypothetical protein
MNDSLSVPRPEIRDLPTIGRGARSAGLLPVQDYLQRFGYLPADGYARGSLDGDTGLGLALFQSRLGLEVTGTFQAETRSTMAEARCGLPDLEDGIDAAIACPWPTAALTFGFGGDGPAGSATEDARDAVRAAFATWAEVVPAEVREASSDETADVVVEWRPAADPDRSMVGGVVAHADWPGLCSVVTIALPKPLHFDATEHTWAVGAVAGALDIESIAVHEVGHLLGLRHSSDRSAVMYPTVKVDFTARTLQADDLAAVRSLYPDHPSTSLPVAEQRR